MWLLVKISSVFLQKIDMFF